MIINHTYVEGYRERIVERPGGNTEPLPAFVPPPMKQSHQEPPVIVVMNPTSPSGERTHEPDRSPNRYPEKERTRDTAPAPKRTDDSARTASPETPVASRQPEPVHSGSDRPAEQKEFAEPDKNNSETIPVTEQNGPDKRAPEAGFKKVGKVVGRQRRYDDLGDNDIEPIRELFLLRHVTGKHWPGLSKDMEAYYEKFYFTRPKKGSKDYAKHVKCWERRTKWIAAHTA